MLNEDARRKGIFNWISSIADGYIPVAVILACYFVMAVGSQRNKSTAFDEIAHVTAGYSYWAYNDYRLHPENGNLPQRWVSLTTM